MVSLTCFRMDFSDTDTFNLYQNPLRLMMPASETGGHFKNMQIYKLQFNW